jgi:hypothetical protein
MDCALAARTPPEAAPQEANGSILLGCLKPDLTRSQHGAAYRLEYLVNTAGAPRPANILAVSGVLEEAVRRLINFNYDDAPLVRR